MSQGNASRQTGRAPAASGGRPAGLPFWAVPLQALLDELQAATTGLSQAEVSERLRRYGPNSIEPPRAHRGVRLLIAQFSSPIMLILIGATTVAMVLGDLTDGGIILAIVLASGCLGFWQERNAGRAVDALLERVQVEVEVVRDGSERAEPIADVVPGDVVVLRAGDIVPADCRVLEAQNLLVDEATLTGESYPAEKAPGIVAAELPVSGRTNAVFLGTHVASGTGTALVVKTGRTTELGVLGSELASRDVTTRFERGMSEFGALLVRAMAVLVTAIFVVNLALDRPIVDSLLFSVALAVGLTPQLLPAIVAVSLSAGARRMAAEKVIVKRLDAIEDFGGMTILCTDKTGTLTAGAAALDSALDLDGRASDDVLRLAGLNAGLQHGYANPLDDAILRVALPVEPARRLDEVPYDFQRRRLSVLVDDGTPTLVTKGALDGILAIAATAESGGATVPLDDVRELVEKRYRELSSEGYRVLGVATRTLPGREHVTAEDETAMTLRGLLAFHDPPKEGVLEAVTALAGLGVSVRLVTGDNRMAARKIAQDVGLRADPVLTGPEIDALGDDRLAAAAAVTDVFAEVEPLHKERLVRAFRASGEIVGFLGDGINDSAALHGADVGISVDTAVDVAKQTAAIVLLDKSLDVVVDGVRLGRETFANTLKYVRVTTSANFGNMLSMAAAAAFLPFLPLLPRQILLLNFLSDIPGMTISTDSVDPDQLERPGRWSVRSIRNFMILFGLISSVFDILTFLILRLVFDAGADLFRSGWFVESTATELAVMLVLRTSRPFWRSRPGRALLGSSIAVAVVTVALPYSALAGPLGFTGLPARVLLALVGLTTVYVAANEVAKRWYRIAR